MYVIYKTDIIQRRNNHRKVHDRFGDILKRLMARGRATLYISHGTDTKNKECLSKYLEIIMSQ